MHLFIFSVEKMYCLLKTTSAVSCVKPNASQWEATLRDDVGFATVYRRIYRRKFLTLSNQTSRYIRECIRITLLLLNSTCLVLTNSVDQDQLASVLKKPTDLDLHCLSLNM